MALGEYIGAAGDAMSALRRVVSQRDWKRLDLAVELHREAFDRLRHYLESFGTSGASVADMSALKQLEITHRRMLRQLAGHMRRTEEDIAMLGRA